MLAANLVLAALTALGFVALGLPAAGSVALAVAGLSFGVLAQDMVQFAAEDPETAELLASLGGSGSIADIYLAAILTWIGMLAAGYAVQATLRLRSEEAEAASCPGCWPGRSSSCRRPSSRSPRWCGCWPWPRSWPPPAWPGSAAATWSAAPDHIEAISLSTRSSWARNGSLQRTVRWAWSLSLRWTQSTV